MEEIKDEERPDPKAKYTSLHCPVALHMRTSSVVSPECVVRVLL